MQRRSMNDRTEGPVLAARPEFERIALQLQGGGALGTYRNGVYQALAETDLQPDWVAGISIGAINSAIDAGSASELRGERLRLFWKSVTQAPFELPHLA
jgi:NTE family protein